MDFSDVAEWELDPVHPGQILLEDFCGLWGYPSTGAKQAVGRSSSFMFSKGTMGQTLLFLQMLMARAKRHCIPGHIWYTPGETLMRATK